jgi:ribosomal protein S18 acetylase RimI-like enzyme
MTMQITTYKPSEIDNKELASFIFEVRRAVLDDRGVSLAELEDRLENVWHFIAYVLARQERDIIGYALLFRIGDSDLIEINPGSILGQHPIVAPGFDEEAVAAAMIETAKECVAHEGFTSLYIDIPWDPTAPPQSYDLYRNRYGKLGFEVIQQVRQMDVSLPADVPTAAIPPGVRLAQIQSVDAEALYQCHHQAYMQGDAQYYFQMDDEERRDDFERIYAPDIRAHPASLVLTKDDRILGYVLLFSQGDFTEVMSLAVHPDVRRQGYGMLLMRECLTRAAQEGHKTMHLIVDVNNQRAEQLYRRCGFTDTGGNMTFKWKA